MNPLERALFKNYSWIQVGVNLCFVLFWFLANEGLAFWDDFTYLNFAHQVNTLVFDITSNHFTSRVGMIYPVAWIIRWTGIDAFSITLYPLVCAMLTLNILMWYGKKTNIWVGLLGGLFLICDYHFLHFSTHLFPEMPMAFCVFLALISYDLVNRKEGDHRVLALLTALALFVAFLIKTTVFLLIPLFLFLFFNDRLRRRRNSSYWTITVLCLLFFVVLNLFHYYEIKGDAFYRFNNIAANHEATQKTFFDKPWQETIKRLTYLPFLGFLRGGFFIPFLLVLPAIITLQKEDWRLNEPKKLWVVSSFLILISWWFMSTNWKYYSPMPIDTRHITFVIPLFILGGLHWWTDSTFFSWLKKKGWPILLVFFIIAVPIFKISKAKDRNFSALEDVFETTLVKKDQEMLTQHTVFTDGLISYGYPYFYDFKRVNLRYVWWAEADLTSVGVGDMILINPAFLNTRYDDFKNLESLKAVVTTQGWQLDCLKSGDLQLCEVVQ